MPFTCDDYWTEACWDGWPLLCLPLSYLAVKRQLHCCPPCGQPRPEPCPPPEPCQPPRVCAEAACPPCPPQRYQLLAELRIPRHRCVSRVCAELTGWYWNNCRLVVCYKLTVYYVNCCGAACEFSRGVRTSCPEIRPGTGDPQLAIDGALHFEVCGCWLKTKLPLLISR